MVIKGWCTCTTGRCMCNADVRVWKGELTLSLKGNKTHQRGDLLQRSLKCCCDRVTATNLVPTCPVCTVKAIARDSTAKLDSDWFLSQGARARPLSYNGFHKEIIAMMKSIGRPVKLDGKHLYGGQSLRRGGAQALAAANWSLAAIKQWGIWSPKSEVAHRYVQNAVLFAGPGDLGVSIFKVSGAADGVPMYNV